MKLKDYSILIVVFFLTLVMSAQNKVSGIISDSSGTPITGVEVYNKDKGYLTKTDGKGYYMFLTDEASMTIVFFLESFQIKEVRVAINQDLTVNETLEQLSVEMNEVLVKAQKAKAFAIKRMKDVEGTAITQGKKQR
jgi:Fe(3+) dicitrate transport protein